MIIAFSGMDGVGKTTLSKQTQELLSKSKSTIRIEMAHYFLLEQVIKFARKTGKLASGIKDADHNVFLHNQKKAGVALLWPYLAFFDDLIRYYVFLLPLSFFIHIVCDRYIYDRLIGFYVYGYLSNDAMKKLVRLVPAPTKTFLLDAEPATALGREQGEKHEPNFYQSTRDIYIEVFSAVKHTIINMDYKPEDGINVIRNDLRI